VGEGCAAGWEKGGLLFVLLGAHESGGMLGGRGLCCLLGERWTASWVRAVLLVGREVDYEAGEGCAPWWGKGGLLGGRGLCC